ncbi:MAG: oligopeptide/dipeptide ABC transporter ATP-binding protein [Ilumatobacteraceae bacterium]
MEYPSGDGRRKFQAVSDVSLDILKGETLGIVGESGCGKSTLARAILRLPAPTHGTVVLNSESLVGASSATERQSRQQMQIILQDPISSINPRRRIIDVVAEPLEIWDVPAEARQARVRAMLEEVGLAADQVGQRRRHELSGGQCQRVCIARALINEPQVLICDEAVSALDVSVQAQILNLIRELKARMGLTILFISHDLAVVRYVSDRVMVMYLGRVCEVGPSEVLYQTPLHPYTAALIASIPEPDPHSPTVQLGSLQGEPPSPTQPPSGCRFRTRCPHADTVCATDEPQMRELRPGQFVACHHPLETSEHGVHVRSAVP